MLPSKIYELSKFIKEIIAPISDELGITYFSYVRTYKDGSKLLLSTNPVWHEYLYEAVYTRMPHLQMPQDWKNNSSKCIIWDHIKNSKHTNPISVCAETEFNRFHSMELSTTQTGYIETLGFSTNKENDKINYYYENAEDLFYKFKFYFLDKASKIIKTAEHNKIITPVMQNKDTSNEELDDIKSKLSAAMKIKKMHICNINGENITMTNKEIECMKWIMYGKSSLEISLIMGIGSTTVNTHINHIKEKVGLFKISQLVRFFCKNNIDLALTLN
jgi:DNA-binding CsgD family transcriptional regulator